MKSSVILTTINNNPHYQNTLKVFLQSLKENAPEEFVKIFLVNNKKSFGDRLKKINSNIEIKHVYKDLTPSRLINKRALYCYTALGDGHKKVAWMDNDIIIRGKLGDFWKIKPDELKIVFKRKKKDKLKFQGGVVVFGNCGEMKRYFWACVKATVEIDRVIINRNYNWYGGQRVMYKLFLEYKLRQVDMSKKYNDCKFKGNSVIWHCKSSHFDDPKFREEFNGYLFKANN